MRCALEGRQREWFLGRIHSRSSAPKLSTRSKRGGLVVSLSTTYKCENKVHLVRLLSNHDVMFSQHCAGKRRQIMGWSLLLVLSLSLPLERTDRRPSQCFCCWITSCPRPVAALPYDTSAEEAVPIGVPFGRDESVTVGGGADGDESKVATSFRGRGI